jgi:hypothetical protein
LGQKDFEVAKELNKLTYPQFKREFLLAMRNYSCMKQKGFKYLSDHDYVNLNGYIQELYTKYNTSQIIKSRMRTETNSSILSAAPSQLSSAVVSVFRQIGKTVRSKSIRSKKLTISTLQTQSKRKAIVPKLIQKIFGSLKKEEWRKPWKVLDLILENLEKETTEQLRIPSKFKNVEYLYDCNLRIKVARIFPSQPVPMDLEDEVYSIIKSIIILILAIESADMNHHSQFQSYNIIQLLLGIKYFLRANSGIIFPSDLQENIINEVIQYPQDQELVPALKSLFSSFSNPAIERINVFVNSIKRLVSTN